MTCVHNQLIFWVKAASLKHILKTKQHRKTRPCFAALPGKGLDTAFMVRLQTAISTNSILVAVHQCEDRFLHGAAIVLQGFPQAPSFLEQAYPEVC